MKQRRTYGQDGRIPLLVALLLAVSGVPASTAQPPAPPSGTAGDTAGLPKIRGLDQPLPERNPLDQVRKGAEETEGAIFVQPDQVVVKPPLLKALIQLQAGLSPYALDADSGRGITLERVLKTALANNLTIKISNTDQQSSKWLYYSALGGFLPSLVNAVSYQMISGKFSSPFGLQASVDTADLVIPNTINWTFFQGGGILFTALQNKHLYRASQYALKGTINDVLYEAANLYYQLALNDALL
ncbi:MAG TPA: TolC family protein, partial [Candidatus Obscuribacterales bacterium]